MSALGVEVVSPESALLQGAATELVCRTTEGNLTVLAGHTDLVGDIIAGEIKVLLEDGTTTRIAVHGGFLQVVTAQGAAAGIVEDREGSTTKATVLVGVAELAGDIDVARAQTAREASEAKLAELGSSRSGEEEGSGRALELSAAEAALARAELRLAVAGATN
ncbi:MAG: ATP synthase delta/epsilon chain alpha-helix domain-containing protein [Actinomycetes bacterium]